MTALACPQVTLLWLVDVCDLGVVLQRVVKYVLIYDGVSLSSGDPVWLTGRKKIQLVINRFCSRARS